MLPRSANQNAPSTPQEARRCSRQRVLKPAKIIFGAGDATIDCLVSNESRLGLLVETAVPVSVPEQVRLQIPGSGMFRALRRWTLGNRIGFEFIGARINDTATLAGMRAIAEVLRNQGIAQAAESLRIARFFNNAELRRLAEDALAATQRLQTALQGA